MLLDVTSLMREWRIESSEGITLRLIDDPGIGSVPCDSFYLDDTGKYQVRLCFAVTDDLLLEAASRLDRLKM